MRVVDYRYHECANEHDSIAQDIKRWPTARSLPICRACRFKLAVAMLDGTAPSAIEQFKRGEQQWQTA